MWRFRDALVKAQASDYASGMTPEERLKRRDALVDLMERAMDAVEELHESYAAMSAAFDDYEKVLRKKFGELVTAQVDLYDETRDRKRVGTALLYTRGQLFFTQPKHQPCVLNNAPVWARLRAAERFEELYTVLEADDEG